MLNLYIYRVYSHDKKDHVAHKQTRDEANWNNKLHYLLKRITTFDMGCYQSPVRHRNVSSVI